MQDERKYELIKHDLSDAELATKKDMLVALLGEIEILQTEKKALIANVSLRLKNKEKELFALRQQVSQGFTEESSEIFEFHDDPKPGQKRIVRLASGEERVVDMSPAERQRAFHFEEETKE